MAPLISSLFTAAVSLPLVLGQSQPPEPWPLIGPYPDTTYPDAINEFYAPGAQSNQTSPESFPSPWGQGTGDWGEAYQKAREFVAQLTLTEKVNMTTGVGWQSELCVGNAGNIPRLAFKGLCLQDSPLGVRFGDFDSALPAGVTIAATWDRGLLYQRGNVLGSEHRDKGVDVVLGPVIGALGRAPAGGRNWEGFSPDPYLSGIAVEETVKGIQDAGVVACTKHYILNEQERFRQPSADRPALSSNVDDVTMHEHWLFPWYNAIRAGTGAIMCSYNQINNTYACQDSYTLNHLLKNELGFQGWVLSDWQAQHSGVQSILAGLDQTMPGDVEFNTRTSYWGANLTAAVLNGTVPQWRLDDAATRIMAGYYYVDRDQNQVEGGPSFSSWTYDTYGYRHAFAQEGYEQVNYHVDVQQDHYLAVRNWAAKGTVLLKNNGVLPLNGKERLTSVFGEDAGENLWGPNGCPDRGCNNGTFAMGWGSGTAQFPYLITPLEAIKAEVRSHRGAFESVLDNFAYTQIAELAHRTAQPTINGVCIAFVNAAAGEGYITVDGNEGDRKNLTFWGGGDQLLRNVTQECNNTVIVIHSPGAIILDEWYDHENVTAIVWAGVPGQESGNAITDILYGKVNPSGKTPFTWAHAREDYGTDVLYAPNNGNFSIPQDNFLEGPFLDYKSLDARNITPIYEFGYGLSYTTFNITDLQVESHGINPYVPTTGMTTAAPTYGEIDMNPSAHVCPDDLDRVDAYIYPCLNSTDLAASSGDPQYGLNWTAPANSQSGSPQPYLASGSGSGAPGGHPQLWDVLFSVTATVTNTGSVAGEEVAQLYVSLGGENKPLRQLRGFDKLSLQAGESATARFDLTRRDLSNWDIVAQNWVITGEEKSVHVGSSSRNLPLSAVLDIQQ